MFVFNMNENNIIYDNKLSYNSKKLIKYIDNNITPINYNNNKCFNYLLCLNNELPKLKNCKKISNYKMFCSQDCEQIFKNNKCQSFIHSIKKNENIPHICKIFKNNNLSHCSSICKNNFISKYKIKKNNDIQKRASFCIIYKILNNKTYILIHKRINKLGIMKHQYFIPGGKVEIGETYIDALIREILEETDIDIKDYIDKINVISNINKIMMIFSIRVDDTWGENIKNEYYEFEKNSYKWIDLELLKEYDNNRNIYINEYKNYISLIKILKYINFNINDYNKEELINNKDIMSSSGISTTASSNDIYDINDIYNSDINTINVLDRRTHEPYYWNNGK